MKVALILIGAAFACAVLAIAGFLVYNRSRAIPIDLPIRDPRQIAREAQFTRIEVLATGKIRVESEMLSVAELERKAVAELWKERPGVLIVSDEGAPFADAVAVLDAMRRAGVERLHVGTKMLDANQPNRTLNATR